MLLSREAVVAAVCACALHVVLLGIAAGMFVTQNHVPTTFLKITLVQPAVPLPLGDHKGREAGVAPEEKLPDPVPPLSKPQPKPKPPVLRSMSPPKPKVKKVQPPKAVVVPTPIEAPAEPTTMTLPLPQEGTPGETGTEKAVGEASNTKDGNGNATSTASSVDTQRGGGGLSARPDYGVNPKPSYPMLARRRGEQGIVRLRVHVRADGSVAEVTVAQSSGFSQLDDAALKTVRDSWRFIPARLDGVPVESWVEVPIHFVLGNA
jgi:protein TonB